MAKKTPPQHWEQGKSVARASTVSSKMSLLEQSLTVGEGTGDRLEVMQDWGQGDPLLIFFFF